jgi:hypothetical protein
VVLIVVILLGLFIWKGSALMTAKHTLPSDMNDGYAPGNAAPAKPATPTGH